jgi:hypothetical protein
VLTKLHLHAVLTVTVELDGFVNGSCSGRRLRYCVGMIVVVIVVVVVVVVLGMEVVVLVAAVVVMMAVSGCGCGRGAAGRVWS